MRLLLVEDSRDRARRLSKGLRASHCTVDVAEDRRGPDDVLVKPFRGPISRP